MRLMLHTAARWLLWTVRQAIPEKTSMKRAGFTNLPTRLVKICARIIETATRIRVAPVSARPAKVPADTSGGIQGTIDASTHRHAAQVVSGDVEPWHVAQGLLQTFDQPRMTGLELRQAYGPLPDPRHDRLADSARQI